MNQQDKLGHGSFKTYFGGFIACLILTLFAYELVAHHLLAGSTLLAAIFALGIMQVLIQLILFLHLGQEEKPFLNLTTFLFMLLVLITIVAGSIWIMFSLNERMMTR